MGKMKLQMADMSTHAGITSNSIEPEPSYQESLQPTMRRPEYWNNLGLSKNRTKAQEEESRKIIEGEINKSDVGTVFIFNDGSCKQNPGPCGAGACVFLPGQEECVGFKKPVSRLASILLGVLVAISIALEFIEKEMGRKQFNGVIFFSDSQSVVGFLTLSWTPPSYQGIINKVKKQMEELRKKGLTLNIDWTSSHADIAGYEIADRLAKSAAEEAEAMEDEDRVVTATDIKRAVKVSCEKKWQRRWNLTNSGRGLFEYRKEICLKRSKLTKPKHPRALSKLRTGYCLVSLFLYVKRF